MTREIKFRAWDKTSKNIYQVTNLGLGPHSWSMLAEGNTTKTGYNPFYPEQVEVMQYTGLKDKNGKEIYEGDIVKYKYLSGFQCEDDYPNGGEEEIREVKYYNGEFLPREKYNEVEDGFYSSRYFDFEIIGNIYENPELLNN